jgi:uncharacterized protein (TIGR03437 family)
LGTSRGRQPNRAGMQLEPDVLGPRHLPTLRHHGHNSLFAATVRPGTLWLLLPHSMATVLGIPYGPCGNRNVAADTYRFCAQPVTAGDSLEVYLTGLGEATLAGSPNGEVLKTGTLTPSPGPLYWAVHKPTVYICDLKLADNYLLYPGLTPGTAGVFQLDLQMPPGVPTGDAVLLRVVMPDNSSDQAPIAIC